MRELPALARHSRERGNPGVGSLYRMVTVLEERKKLKDGKTTRQITRKAKWDHKCKVVRDKISNKLRYMTYYDLDADNYRCATGQIWITGGVN